MSSEHCLDRGGPLSTIARARHQHHCKRPLSDALSIRGWSALAICRDEEIVLLTTTSSSSSLATRNSDILKVNIGNVNETGWLHIIARHEGCFAQNQSWGLQWTF